MPLTLARCPASPRPRAGPAWAALVLAIGLSAVGTPRSSGAQSPVMTGEGCSTYLCYTLDVAEIARAPLAFPVPAHPAGLDVVWYSVAGTARVLQPAVDARLTRVSLTLFTRVGQAFSQDNPPVRFFDGARERAFGLPAPASGADVPFGDPQTFFEQGVAYRGLHGVQMRDELLERVLVRDLATGSERELERSTVPLTWRMVATTTVPEPSTTALVSTGLLVLLGAAHHGRRRS